jgi:hypothetical protein
MDSRRRALIVATDTYDDPGLGKLRAPVHDADALAGVLADADLGNFEVDVLHNGTNLVISERVESLLADGRPQDLILMHFSGHGLKNADGELYLAATNTRPTLLASTGVDASLVFRLAGRSRSRRVVLFLDCCYGGAFERGSMPRAAGDIDMGSHFQRMNARESDVGRGLAVITASSSMEFAFEGTELGRSDVAPSVFTGALVEGLKSGRADRDQDGQVALGELYDYVYDSVKREYPKQSPGKWLFGLEGELYIAKNPRRDVIPGELPADLQAAIRSADRYLRQGAVVDLRRLASGAELPLAAAARGALERMLGDDSKSVEDAARDALDRTRVHVSPASVDFGEVRASSASPVRTATISGPPLVEAMVITPSIPAIQVRRVEGDLQIQIDTATPGRLEGVIELSGRAGNERIGVTAVITAAATAEPVMEPVPQPALVPTNVQAATAAVAGVEVPGPQLSSGFAAIPQPSIAGADVAAAAPAAAAQEASPSARVEKGAAQPGFRPIVRATIGFTIALFLYSIVEIAFAESYVGGNVELLLIGPLLGLVVTFVEAWVPPFRVSREGLGRWVATRWQMGLVQGLLLGAVIGLVAGQGDFVRGIVAALTLGVGFGGAEAIIQRAESLRA